MLYASIRKHKPNRLFIIADGPRSVKEQAAVNAAREVWNQIDWPCEITRIYSDINLGCRKRVVTGLDLVFSQVERSLILEDDCIPNDSFFSYAEELLVKYSNTDTIWTISGTTFASKVHANSYLFSSYSLIWGWATWSRAWKHYKDSIDDNSDVLKNKFGYGWRYCYWRWIFYKVKTNKRDSWAYRWMLSHWRENAYAIIPPYSLVNNHGITPEATHTKHQSYDIMPTKNWSIPSHPSIVELSQALDDDIENHCYSRTIAQRIKWFKLRFFKS